MTIRRRNPRHQGDIGVGAAIAWFMENGYRVFAPLSESQPYDLVVEDRDGRLLRVQVKTTTQVSEYGVYKVGIKTAGGNQSFHTVKPFDPAAVDLLFVLTDDRDRYLIPADAIRAKTQINLGQQYRRFRVS